MSVPEVGVRKGDVSLFLSAVLGVTNSGSSPALLGMVCFEWFACYLDNIGSVLFVELSCCALVLLYFCVCALLRTLGRSCTCTTFFPGSTVDVHTDVHIETVTTFPA